jgi:hypothetical protein
MPAWLGRCSARSRQAGRRRAAVAGIVAVLSREVVTHVLLDCGAAGHPLAEARALFAELVGDRGGDQVVLGCEVGVEGAVGQPRVGHERGDPGAVDAVALEPAADRLDDPPPCRLLVLVGAANSVTAADLVALCRTRILKLGVWLREGLTLRHCQYP